MLAETLGRLTALIVFPLVVMLLIGSVYYFAVRPRFTWRQALFRPWLVVVGVATFLLAICGQVAQRL